MGASPSINVERGFVIVSKNYLADGEKGGKESFWSGSFPTEEAFKKSLVEKGVHISNIATAHDHHRCIYCFYIAEGEDRDILCPSCQALFGQERFSDLKAMHLINYWDTEEIA